MRRSAYIGAAILLLVVLAGYWNISKQPITTTSEDRGKPGPEAHPPRPPRLPLPDDTTHVIFPGFEPLRFSNRQTSTMAEIIRPYEPLDETLNDTMPYIDSFRKTPLELTTDDKGRILKIVANQGLFPTVANRKGIAALFKQQDVEIVHLGNDAANLMRKTFMLGLLSEIYHYGCLNTIEFRETEGAVIVPITELEIIPITYIDRRKPHDGEPSTEERPGLLWMAKHRQVPDESPTMWNSEIPIEDARWVEWTIVPIGPVAPELQYWRTLDQDNWIKTREWTFELKIRSPNDPPEPHPTGSPRTPQAVPWNGKTTR